MNELKKDDIVYVSAGPGRGKFGTVLANNDGLAYPVRVKLFWVTKPVCYSGSELIKQPRLIGTDAQVGDQVIVGTDTVPATFRNSVGEVVLIEPYQNTITGKMGKTYGVKFVGWSCNYYYNDYQLYLVTKTKPKSIVIDKPKENDMRVPFTVSNDSITVFINGDMRVIPSSDGAYAELREHLKSSTHDFDLIEQLIDKPKRISRLTAGLVKVEGSTVTYAGQAIHSALTAKLIDLLDDGFDATPWAKFMDRVMLNPSMKSRESLFNFLEHFKTPITEDGHFLAFKRVRGNYKDLHSNTFDNSPGKLVEMNRADVNDDSRATCSYGLHACASSYLGHFYSNSSDARVVVVKIDPKDVVSVPYDYNFSKMRVCKYLVLADVTKEEIEKISQSSYYATYKVTPPKKEQTPMHQTDGQKAQSWWNKLSSVRKLNIMDAYTAVDAEYKWTKSNYDRRIRIWQENK